MDGIISLEKAALERLTADRIASGSLGEELEDILSEAGIYWDMVDKEYFSIEAFQHEILERLVAEYASPDYT
jgi:NTP pyrophosphatase (non-canonical NTP hydrolase)